MTLNSNILSNSISVKKNENILIISDEPEIASFFSDEAKKLCAIPTIILLTSNIRPIPFLSIPLQKAIENSDVILTLFKKVTGELLFRKQIIRTVEETHSSRLAHMPNVDMDMISNCIKNTDYEEMRKIGDPLIQVLARTEWVEIKTVKGTHLSFKLGGWKVRTDGGFKKINHRGSWDNLPTGEVFKVPLEKSINGTLVIDGAIPNRVIKENEEIVLNIKNGKIIKIEDRSNAGFENYLEQIEAKATKIEKGGIYKICEFGIGLNKYARKTSKAIEYEKRLGTAHLALGDNSIFNGNIKAPEHLDLMFENPTIRVNGIMILDKGKMLINNMKRIYDHSLKSYTSTRKIKITRTTKIIPTTNFGAAKVEKNKLLYRYWVTPGKSYFRTLVGNNETAKLSAIAWLVLSDASIDLEQFLLKMKCDKSICMNLIHLLYDFHLVELKDDLF